MEEDLYIAEITFILRVATINGAYEKFSYRVMEEYEGRIKKFIGKHNDYLINFDEIQSIKFSKINN